MSFRGSPVVAVLLSLLLIISCRGAGEAMPAPLFGTALLASALAGGGSTNGTSALGLLALSHLQHKIDTLNQIAELFALSGNVTNSFFIN